MQVKYNEVVRLDVQSHVRRVPNGLLYITSVSMSELGLSAKAMAASVHSVFVPCTSGEASTVFARARAAEAN